MDGHPPRPPRIGTGCHRKSTVQRQAGALVQIETRFGKVRRRLQIVEHRRPGTRGDARRGGAYFSAPWKLRFESFGRGALPNGRRAAWT